MVIAPCGATYITCTISAPCISVLCLLQLMGGVAKRASSNGPVRMCDSHACLHSPARFTSLYAPHSSHSCLVSSNRAQRATSREGSDVCGDFAPGDSGSGHGWPDERSGQAHNLQGPLAVPHPSLVTHRTRVRQ